MIKPRGRPISRDGIELRKAIRTDADANPATTHQDLRRKFGVPQPVIESAMTRTVAEWDACIVEAPKPVRAGTPNEPGPAKPAPAKLLVVAKPAQPPVIPAPAVKMPGLEQGYVKFTRTPGKMGEDYIFWIPRVYVRNGLVDTSAEYEVYLVKAPKKKSKVED
nr:hypothetical protein [Candidatus Sigynarchaeota archaeon]